MSKKSLIIFFLAILMCLSAAAFVACNDNADDGKFSVTFYEYRGADSAVIRVDEGSKVSKPESDPIRDGYIFDGWASDKRGKNPFDFENTVIEDDTIIYAKWKSANATVYYDYNYSGAPTTEVKVPLGGKAEKPQDPTRENYGFLGWFKDPKGSEQFNFNTAIDEDTYIYAFWGQLKATVTFDLNYEGAPAIPEIVIDLNDGNSKVTEPATPVRGDEGDYRFDGWFTGSGKKETKFNFDLPVVADVRLHAKWTKLKATVTFNMNYEGAQNSNVKVVLGEKFTQVPAPARTGYTFDTWYFDEACTYAYDFENTAIDNDITVYAGWNANPLTITYNYNYSGAPEASTVNSVYDAVVVEPQEPTRTGDTFIGWFTDAAQQNEYVFGGKLTDNLILYAGWESAVSGGGNENQPNENGNWEIKYYMNDGTDNVFRYNGKEVEEVGNARYSGMRGNIVYPERTGYLAIGWYTDAACTQSFNFDARIRQNYSLYAKWLKENVFEAEYTQFENIGENQEDKAGFGESSNPKGTGLIEWDQYNANASNGYYVSYLFRYGSYLEFHVTATEEVEDAVLVLRASVDLYDMFFETGINTGDEDGFGIYVNDKRYSFDYDLTGAIPPPSKGGNGYEEKRPFEDYVISMKISLKKGDNVIRLVTENNRMFYGTMAASAPMIDCIKIYTNTEISWTEGWNFKEYNEDKIKDRWADDRLE